MADASGPNNPPQIAGNNQPQIVINPPPLPNNPPADTGDVEQSVSSFAELPFDKRYKLAQDNIPAFEATSLYNVDSFITKLGTANDTYHIPPQDQVTLALSRLAGEATGFQTELRETSTIPTDFKVFCDRLRLRFPLPPEETAPFLLVNELYMKGTLLAKYIQDFTRQVSRLGSAEAGRTALLQEIFLSGLSGNLRQTVEPTRPEGGWGSLAALQQSCVTAQQNLHLHGVRPKPETSGSSQNSGKRGRQQTAAGPSRLSEVNTSLWCNGCKKAGHEDSQCWTQHPNLRPAKKPKLAGKGRGRGRGQGQGRGQQQSKN